MQHVALSIPRVTGRGKTVQLIAALILAAFAPEAGAQMFSYDVDRPRAVQSLSFTYQAIDFRYDGSGVPMPSFEYSGPAFGGRYTRPNFRAAIAYGREPDSERHLRLLDASVMTWGELRFGRSGPTGLFVPIAIHTNYRRVAPHGSEDSIIDSFNISVLGLGAGLGYAAQIARKLRIHARALPGVGLALRAFGDSAGSSYLFDVTVDLHLSRLAGRFGLSAGYDFRAQAWNVGASELLGEESDDLLDYSGNKHVLSVGVNW